MFTHIPRQTHMASILGPLLLESVLSFCMTPVLAITSIYWNDGTAIIAICTISLASTIIGDAAWWMPVLTRVPLLSPQVESSIPSGDPIIRSREGAFCLIRCSNIFARELHSGDQECRLHAEGVWHLVCMTVAAVLIKPSVILLGNCTFNIQALIGAAYIALNDAYWDIGLLSLQLS